MSDTTPATTLEVLYTFLDIPVRNLVSYNWGTAPTEHRAEWHCNDETYINGVVMTIDFDFMMGYLIEYVDRTTSAIGFMVIVTYHGRDKYGNIEHDFVNYPPACGTFFDRTDAADHWRVSKWAVDQIYGTVEAHQEALRSERDDH